MLRWAIVFAIAGCSFRPGSRAAGDGGDDSGGGGSDAAPADVTGTDALDGGLGAWGTPVFVPLVTVGVPDDPTLTDDLLELDFNANNDVYVAKRALTTDPWGTPVLVPMISSANDVETTPEISYDGKTMFVASDRPGGMGGDDIWISIRANRTAPWGAPTLVAALNSPSADTGAVMTPDKLTVAFTSTKLNGSADIFIAERANAGAPFGTPVEVAAVNTSAHEGSAFITADKLWLYFDTDRNGGPGLDIYYSHRASVTDPFPAPQPLSDINTAADEQDPWVSSDDRHLFFYSDRGGMIGLWESSR